MSKDDFEALAFIALVIAFACIVGMVAAMMAHVLTRMFWYVGATEAPAAWLAYVFVFFIIVFVVSGLIGRVSERRWWFRG